jgi:sugar fermentation stimulation protein A
MDSNPKLFHATFLRRYKRFFADLIDSEGNIITVHCPNTGSMKNCLEPYSCCWYSLSSNPKRKLKGTLEIVTTKYGALAGVNTARANNLVRTALETKLIPELSVYDVVKSEIPYGKEQSRIDFLLQDNSGEFPDCYLEVKNVTLDEGNGLAMFPDSVTARGTKHLRELIFMAEKGFRSMLFFCVQLSDAKSFSIASNLDPVYAGTVKDALDKGIEIIAWRTLITSDSIALQSPINVTLNTLNQKTR